MNARWSSNRVSLAGTILVCGVLYVAAALRYRGFVSGTVCLNLLHDNAFLGLCAIGMTFVILSGGIDLSVGAMVGLASVLVAVLIHRAGVHPAMAIPLVLIAGTASGAGMGCLIHYFQLPPFLVTLGGMFLARGLGLIISLESVTITHRVYQAIDGFSFRVFPVTVIAFVLAVVVAVYVAGWTPFGRAVYAVGGSESSALLMGLPVARTKIRVYAISGLCSSAGGVLYTFYTLSGNATAGTMLELDAIAAVVIGGTLLSGGIGQVAGTFFGVLTFGIIQTAIVFEGTLSSWWTRIVVGGLLLAFILVQRLVQARIGRS